MELWVKFNVVFYASVDDFCLYNRRINISGKKDKLYVSIVPMRYDSYNEVLY